DAVVNLVGRELAEKVRDATLAIYKWAAAYAAGRGIILADTKFEFGTDADGYQVGISPPSYDKQFVRDWLEAQGWNKSPPGPVIPDEVIARTAAKYGEALERLADIKLD